MYRAPSAGYYQISATIYHYVPTNFMVWEENANRFWWQFWKPRFVLKPGFKYFTTEDGTQIVYKQAGDPIDINAIRL